MMLAPHQRQRGTHSAGGQRGEQSARLYEGGPQPQQSLAQPDGLLQQACLACLLRELAPVGPLQVQSEALENEREHKSPDL